MLAIEIGILLVCAFGVVLYAMSSLDAHDKQVTKDNLDDYKRDNYLQ